MPSPSEPFDPRQPTADSVPAATPQPETVSLAHPEQAADTTAPLVPAPPAGAPTIPGYRITAEIAKGGMGRVYAAFDETLDREVAIKTLLPGADAERFVVEAKITARLPHPAIPPVHALGRLDDGTPWLAMKLIHGQTLAKLLQSRDREGAGKEPDDSRRRLEDLPRFVQVFEQIAQAVGFAHSRGIIHRDLKPLNVMVGEFGEVQVMDWGLAKNLANPGRQSGGADPASPGRQSGGADLANPGRQSGESADNVHHTAAGTILGTPGYMAPEQARGEVVDARADVFALGSILAKILTGKPAFVGSSKLDTIQKAANADLADVLSRLDACGADSELVALAKHCLSAKAEDRPANGQAVAQEVAAYRAGVEARLRQAETDRARAETQAAEQAKRRRVVQWGGGLIAAVLLLGMLGTTIGLLRANTAAEKERLANLAAQEAAAAEKRAKETTERRLAQIEKGVELFARMLGGINPRSEQQGGEPLYVQLRQQAEKAAEELDAEAVGDPLAVARLQTILGSTLRDLGSPRKALEVLEKSRSVRERDLGADHPDTLTTLNNLAQAYAQVGRLPDAIPLYERVYADRVKKLGAEHPHTLNTLSDLAGMYLDAGRVSDAIVLYELAYAAQVKSLGAEHPDTLAILNNLAVAYLFARRVNEAISALERIRDSLSNRLGSDHSDTLTALTNLAGAYQDAGRVTEAIALYERVHATQVRKLGAEHPDTLTTLNRLAVAYRVVGKLTDAISILEKVRDVKGKQLGPDHPDTLNTLNSLAVAYRDADRLQEAIALFEYLREVQPNKLGADHPFNFTTLSNLAEAYKAAGRLPEALPLFEQAADGIVRRHFQDQHARLIIRNTIRAYEEAKQFEKAEGWRRQWLAHVKSAAGSDSPAYAGELAALGLNLLTQQKWTDAESVLRECLAIREKKEPDAWTTFNTMSLLGGALQGQARSVSDGVERTKLLNDAEPLLLKGYEGMKAREKTPPSDADRLALRQRLAEALDRLIELYTLLHKPAEIEKYRALRAEYSDRN